jgi:cadmium resistance protein CadD (predicted permease)
MAVLLKILGITGLIMLVPIYAMLKVASDADDMEEEYFHRALEFKEKKED